MRASISSFVPAWNRVKITTSDVRSCCCSAGTNCSFVRYACTRDRWEFEARWIYIARRDYDPVKYYHSGGVGLWSVDGQRGKNFCLLSRVLLESATWKLQLQRFYYIRRILQLTVGCNMYTTFAHIEKGVKARNALKSWKFYLFIYFFQIKLILRTRLRVRKFSLKTKDKPTTKDRTRG